MGWLSDHLWIAWFTVAALLAAGEMTLGEFSLLMLAGGAAAGGVVALIAPGLVWLQILVAAIAAVALLAVVRPALRTRFASPDHTPMGTARLVGRTAAVTQAIPAGGTGRVELAGETWTARAYTDDPIQAGTQVDVFEIDGATAVVHPATLPLDSGIELPLDRVNDLPD